MNTSGSVNDSVKKVQTVVSAQGTLLKVQAARVVRSIVLSVVSLVFAGTAIAVLHYAIFSALHPIHGRVLAALFVGGGDLLLAFLFFRIATADAKETELERLARQVSQASMESLGQDLEEVKGDLREVVGSINDLRDMLGMVRRLVQAPLQVLSSVIFDSLKQRRSTPVSQPED